MKSQSSREPAQWGQANWAHGAATGPTEGQWVTDTREPAGLPGLCMHLSVSPPVPMRHTFPAALGAVPPAGRTVMLCDEGAAVVNVPRLEWTGWGCVTVRVTRPVALNLPSAATL